MSEHAASDGVRVLNRALDQVGDVLDHVHEDRLGDPTPCQEWDVATLVDHLVADPANFVTMLSGGQPDWSAPPRHVASGWAAEFRNHADDLIHRWHQLEAQHDAPTVPPQMQVAEFAVHAWDLARAIGWPTERLDPEVAETALGFMRGALKPEMRGDAFAPELPAPEGAGPYEALAAFTGRAVDAG